MIEQKVSTAIIAGTEQEVEQVSSEIKDIDGIALVGSACNVDTAMSVINNYEPQLLLVDVKIDHFCGLKFVQKLRDENIFSEVAFMASGPSEAYDTLPLKPLDYLLKPVRKENIDDLLVRLKNKLKRDDLKQKMDIYARHHDIAVKRVFHQNRGIVVLYLDEIVSCNADRSKTIVTLVNNERIVLKTNLTETIRKISDQRFFRINRSHCINRTYLRKIDKKKSKCLLYHGKDSWEIPASRNAVKKLEALYTNPVY